MYRSSRDDTTVAFRFAALPARGGEVGAICLSYDHEADARGVSAAIDAYMAEVASSRSGKPLLVEFNRDSPSSHTLKITFSSDTTGRIIEIVGVDASYVDRLASSLAVHSFILIVFGYTTAEGQFRLLPIADHHVLRNAVTIDGLRITGNPRDTTDWEELIGSPHLLRGSDGTSL